MRRLGALLFLGTAALLVTPGAPGEPDVPGDPTPPVVTPQITGTLGAEGWYTSNVTVNWSVTDPESIILSTSGCDARTLTADTVGTKLTCTAESDGGETIISKTFKLDKTAPGATATPSRAADANGWYNHALSVDFAAGDGTSGVASCADPRTYAGPDTAAASLSGTCVDHAGNTGQASFPFKYDETAPQASPAARPADASGWYNHAVTVSFQGADVTSGVASCSQTTYAGPDDPSVSLSGTCLDRAGNASASSLFTLKYDESPPAATATASRGADVNGWYNHALTVTFAGSDAMSGLDSCDAPKTYSGPDAGTASVSGACRDNAGNAAPRAVSLKYDATPPQAAATPSRQANAQGWYNAPLTVSFAGTDATSGNASCVSAKSYGGPDAASTTVGGTCTDNAGNVGATTFALKYDATAPTATASPSRQPNENGWYRASLNVTFAGADTTSGIDTCDTAKTYAGPDAAAASLSGTCRDRAGNQSAAGTFGFKYDATAPLATASAARQPNPTGWYTAPVAVSFAATDALSGVDSCAAQKIYSGPDAAATDVTGTCLDEAGNTGNAALPLRYDATAPAASATPSRQPNTNGWYNAPLSVSFAATDTTSGVDTCDASKTYSGPDNGSATVAGSCRDKAGNAASASVPVKYDATAPQPSATPSRQPNASGWYNAPLSVSFAATDTTSGLDSCPAAQTYSGPDNGAATVNGTCLDKAGNGALASLPLKYDATAPSASATPSRQPNANGWYNAAVSVSFAGSDTLSGLESCPTATSYSGPDSLSAVVSGTCLDRAGNGTLASLPLKFDATEPATSATAARQPNANGWYNAPVSVSFAATDQLSAVESCDAAKTYSGPDSGSATVAGSCRDKAGNAASASVPVKYDATAPQTSASPSRQPNANGWYNAALSVSFVGTDSLSTIDSCDAPKTYSGPDSASTSVGGACRDKAGNSDADSYALKYDATAPQTTATASRQPNVNGWYNAPLSVSFAGADALSTIDSCDAAKSYSGPDSASTSVGGACRDKAGNAATASVPLKYDATAPQATATPSRQPNGNGWYNAAFTVSFAGNDPMSGLDSCPAPIPYSGPDTGTGAVSGTCRDKAGNGALISFPVRYDATAPTTVAVPSRDANGEGWYNAALTVSFDATDTVSGKASCDAPKGYSGPDTATVGLSGSCSDRAGNADSDSFAFKYDATRPVVTSAVPVRLPDRNGWYNRPVVVAAEGSDATSGIASCTGTTYSGPDGDDAPIAGTCLDVAGNVGAKGFTIDYDATAPQATASPNRNPDANGWYNHAVTVGYAAGDAVSGVESCASPESYDGPDSAAAVMTGICFDKAGNAAVASYPLAYDATAPQVTGVAPDREPDAGGWYNRALEIRFRGSDETSGIEACTDATYAGPDSLGALVTGSCRDRAANGSAAASFALRYDATAPTVTRFVTKAGNGKAELSWSVSPDTTLVEVRRSERVVYRGTDTSFTDTGLENGTRYRYALTALDEARNAATAGAVAAPTAPLVSPAAGAKVSAPPRLAWMAAPKATYYNVQVWRRGRILSLWPRGTAVRLRRTWTYDGRRYRLTPGRYRWFVWPGYGKRSAKKFGKLVGSSSFVVVR